MSNPLLSLLDIDYPLIQAPMAGVSTPALAAAVSNAGALGSLGLGLVMGALTSITLKALLPALGKMGFSTQEKRGE